MSFDWWTLGLQTVNVAVLVWLLSRVLWRPVADAIAARQAAAARVLDDASAARDAAAATRQKIEAERVGIEAERQARLDEARKEAESERLSILDKARAEAEAMATRASARRAAEAEAAEAAYAGRALELARSMAGKIGTSLAGPALRDGYLDSLMRRVAALGPDERTALLAAPLTVITAEALPEAESATLKERLAAALGGEPGLHFDVRPSLICGYEIATAHIRLAANWENDLASICREVADAA